MHWLILSLFFSFGFGQLFKWSQRCGCNAPTVVSTNYLVLAGVLIAYYLIRGELVLTMPILKVGGITGVAFIISMLVMTRALEIADVSAVLTAFRLSIVVPILTSVWIWGEVVSTVQVIGLFLTIVSLFLMTRGNKAEVKLTGLATLGLVAAIFSLQGFSHATMGWIHYAGLDPQRQLVLLVISFVAGSLGTVYIVLRRIRPRPRDLAMGTGIGLYNLVALFLTLTALSKVSGTLFFSLQGCAVVMMDNFFAHYYWKEKLSRPAKIGALIGAFAMLLVLKK